LNLGDLKPFASYLQEKLYEWFGIKTDESSLIGYLAKLIYEQDEKSLILLMAIAMMDQVAIHSDQASLPPRLEDAQKKIVEESL
jgi:hypothetical protein